MVGKVVGAGVSGLGAVSAVVALFAQTSAPGEIAVLDVILQGGSLAILGVLLLWVLPKAVDKIIQSQRDGLQTFERVNHEKEERFAERQANNSRLLLDGLGSLIRDEMRTQTREIVAELRRALVEIGHEYQREHGREEHGWRQRPGDPPAGGPATKEQQSRGQRRGPQPPRQEPEEK